MSKLTVLVYGCFISKLQQTVRAFYDIDGTNVEDLSDAIFCPCCTLCRNDEEIYRREMREKKLDSLRDSFLTESSPEYKPHKPMAHGLQDGQQPPLTTSPPRAKSATFGGKELDDDLSGLAPIPEMSRVASASGAGGEAHSPPQSPGAKALSPSASPDAAAKAGKHLAEISKRVILQHFGRFWYDPNTNKKENDKPKSEDGTSAERAVDTNERHSLDDHNRYATHAVSRHAAHGLEEHSKIAADANKVQFREHLIDQDKPAAPSPVLVSPHVLTSDPVLSRVHASSPHRLESDIGASSHAVTGTGHDLTVDSTMAMTRTPPAHQLNLDPLGSTRPKGLWPSSARHDLYADEVTSQPNLLPHTLPEDAAGDPIKRTVSPHRLEGDEVHQGVTSTSHAVENDTQQADTARVFAQTRD